MHDRLLTRKDMDGVDRDGPAGGRQLRGPGSDVRPRRTAEERRGGIGLGPHLARRLVELHGGSIHAESAGPGLGAEFTVRLPCMGAPEAKRA